MKDLITTKEELFEKFKGQSEEYIKALVQETMLGVYSEKRKLEDAAIEYHRLNEFYEYVKGVDFYFSTNKETRPGGSSNEEYNELVEVLHNNN